MSLVLLAKRLGATPARSRADLLVSGSIAEAGDLISGGIGEGSTSLARRSFGGLSRVFAMSSRSSAETREPAARDGSGGEAKAHAHLCLDQPALAQWGMGADELWFPCRILSLRHDGTVDVKYDDGNIERSKLASRVVNCTPAEAAQHAIDGCDASSSVSVSVPGEASSSTSVPVKQQV